MGLRAGMLFSLDRTAYHENAIVPPLSTDLVICRLVDYVPENLEELVLLLRLKNTGLGDLTSLRLRARWDGVNVSDRDLFTGYDPPGAVAPGGKAAHDLGHELGDLWPIDLVGNSTAGTTLAVRLTFD